ncbi:sulfocyanin-like copper-binding protein [Aestuariivirga sp.]|uniref:sulfocyanin-like copper-binding protein n=1 Tax=Aestuariivirga sp. TaxID=2650926 RepID=UPI0039E3197E
MNRLFAPALFVLTLTSGLAFAATPTVVTVKELGEGGGAMKIEMDKTELPAGSVVFKVTNDAMTETHEMVLVHLKSADQQIAVVPGKHRIDESKLKSLGEVSHLKPGASGELKATLTPGSYMLLCNIKGHFEAGMYTKFTVAK